MSKVKPDYFGRIKFTNPTPCMQTFFRSLKCLCAKCRPDLHSDLTVIPEDDLIQSAADDLQHQIDKQIINSLLNP